MFARVLSTRLRKASAAAVVTTGVGLGYIKASTTFTTPLPSDNPALSSASFRQWNPHRNTAWSDVVTREIPLDRIRPELLENEEKLTLELCRGVWSSVLGFDLGRLYYYLRHYSPETASHLWSRKELVSSEYEVGTAVTNHFNVVEHTPSEILFRFADSPSLTGLRPFDGLFAIGTQIDREAGVARLSFTTLMFIGDQKVEAGPLPVVVEVVHSWVSRFWMVLASRRVVQ